jgi:hypothetical protein
LVSWNFSYKKNGQKLKELWKKSGFTLRTELEYTLENNITNNSLSTRL